MSERMILDTRTCNEYHSLYECKEEEFGRAVAIERQPHDLRRVPTQVPEQRRLLGALEGTLLSERDALPELREAFALPSHQGTDRLLLSVLRASGLPDSGHDFSQVLDIAPTLVLGDLPNRVEKEPLAAS
jgi:hypothetical protein